MDYFRRALQEKQEQFQAIDNELNELLSPALLADDGNRSQGNVKSENSDQKSPGGSDNSQEVEISASRRSSRKRLFGSATSSSSALSESEKKQRRISQLQTSQKQLLTEIGGVYKVMGLSFDRLSRLSPSSLQESQTLSETDLASFRLKALENIQEAMNLGVYDREVRVFLASSSLAPTESQNEPEKSAEHSSGGQNSSNNNSSEESQSSSVASRYLPKIRWVVTSAPKTVVSSSSMTSLRRSSSPLRAEQIQQTFASLSSPPLNQTSTYSQPHEDDSK